MGIDLASAFANRTGYRSVRNLPCIRASTPEVLDTLENDRDVPVVARGLADTWPARELWSDSYLRQRWGQVPVKASVDLPDHGAPYLQTTTHPRRAVSLAEFYETLLPAGRCYIDQHPVSYFPEMAEDVPVHQLLGKKGPLVANFWFGRATKSGMHFDRRDNLLTMLRGTKLAVLAAPREASNLYPLTDRATKSQLDVESPDWKAFPRAADAQLWVSELHAGDALYIPIRWWHYLAAGPDPSVSVNCWFGRRESLASRLRYLHSLGTDYVMQTFRDLVVHGLLGRPFTLRYFAGPPEGVQLYEYLKQHAKQALRWPRNDNLRAGRVVESL